MNPLPWAVVPVIIGPLQVLIAILPVLLLSLGGLLLGLLRPRAMWAGVKFLWRQKLAVAVLAGVLAGSVFLVRTISSGSGPATESEQAAGEDWPVFRGDAARRGSGGGGEPPADGGLVWSYAGDVKTFYCSPAVVGNRVYVSSADKGPLRDRGAIYCLDADTGAVVWKVAPSGYAATFSSPVVAGNFLACGEGLHYTVNARVMCMDLARQKILWTYQTHGHVESTPCIDKGRVYVGAGDDGYYCFRLEPDAAGQAVVLWHAPTERCPDADTAPAIHDGRVVVGCGIDGNAICCLNADTGAELWRLATPYPVFGAPTIVGPRVVLGMGNGNFVESAEEVKRKQLDKFKRQGKSAAELAAAEKILGPAGEVWCLDDKTGRVEWKYALGEVVLGAIAAGKDRLYFAARDGFVYCLSTAGKELGKWNAHAPIVASPALSGGLLYVVTETGKLYGLRADEMELAWEATLGFSGLFLSSPTVARSHVYVGSEAYGLLCIGKPASRKQEPCWAGCLGGPGSGGTIDNQPLPEKGKFAWRFPKSEDTERAPDFAITAPPACLGGAIYLPLHGGRNGLVCLREDPQKRNEAVEGWFAAAGHGVWLSPAATPQAVFFVDGRRGDPGRRLHCVSATDGAEQWKLPVAADASGEFVLLDHGGLLADGRQQLTCFGETGEVAWRAECGAVSGVPAAGDCLLAVATEHPPALLVLDRPTGEVLWRLALDSAPTAPPLLRKNAIYLGTQSGVAALRLADGERIWQSQGGPPSTPLVLAKNRLAYINAAGSLLLVTLEDGRVEQALSGARPGLAPLAAAGTFLYAGNKGLMAFSGNGQPRLWMNTDWLGPLAVPPVMANSRVYFATAKKGLVSATAKEGAR
jgi:outer membrane protein assembly factor BamB